ncbi:hypothetical protein cyc_00876 [Cyclospora cayetanensis]|uniref:Uncharacterized protein n=1 Tax=Cyclospora cayetanensis TaxID=88456 RepID=A0A1D3CVA1_9EIME|nr:hypothetical protein cyc_00876 [Cyclospora cayetanensis]
MQRPACTALLSPTGILFIMGGITKEQALWQAFRVAYKTECLQGSEHELQAKYLCRQEVEFNPHSATVLQLVCRVDLGGSYRPNVRAILDHPQLRALAIDTRDGVAVRIPNVQGYSASQKSSGNGNDAAEDLAGELFAFDAEGEGRELRAEGSSVPSFTFTCTLSCFSSPLHFTIA